MNASRERAAEGAFAILGAILKMSNEAEALGGARSLAGVASLNKLQSSLQKNGPRMAALYAAFSAKEETAA